MVTEPKEAKIITIKITEKINNNNLPNINITL